MSAHLVVDIGGGCDFFASIASPVGVDGTPASGVIIGRIVDLANSDTHCNVMLCGGPTSGPLGLQVQTSDGTTSGSFTDPTSGLVAFPAGFSSGGIAWMNSGLYASGNQALSAHVNNAPLFHSGGVQFAAFQRPHRYARVIALSGTFTAPLTAGFVTNKRTLGSGGGFTLNPTSGAVDV